MNPIAVAPAFRFLGSVSAIFRKRSTASPRSSQPIRHAQPGSTGHCIIVPLMESAVSMQAVEVACQLASERKAKLILAYVIEVPYTLGLDVPLPGAQDRERRLLLQGASIAEERGLQTESRILWSHLAEEAIVELSRETGAEAIVVGMTSAAWLSVSQIGRTVSGLFQHAPCQVVIAKPPLVA